MAKSCKRSWPRRAPAISPPAASCWNWRRAIAVRTIRRAIQAPAFKAELAAIAGGRDVIERGLRAYRPNAARAAAAVALHHLLERQHYRLAHWRLAGSEINYRRFFDINTLAGLRVEDRGTFDADPSRSSRA